MISADRIVKSFRFDYGSRYGYEIRHIDVIFMIHIDATES